MSDLFADSAVTNEVQPKPRSSDLRTEYLKERYNLPEGWVWHSFEVIGDFPSKFALFKGGVYPRAIQRGKYKGRTDYRAPVLGTEAQVVLDDDAFEEWLPVWEARTGKCSTCHGRGQKWTSWHHERGNSYVDCPRCNATGDAPASVDTHPKGGDAKLAPSSMGSAVGNAETPND